MSTEPETDVPPTVPPEETVLFPKKKKAPTKASLIQSFAERLHNEELIRGNDYIQTFLHRPTFDLQALTQAHTHTEFPSTIAFFYSMWQVHRDSGFHGEFDPLHVVEGAWATALQDPSFEEVCAEIPEAKRYVVWLTGEDVEQVTLPEGWPGWTPGQAVDAVKKPRAKKALNNDDEAAAALKPKKEPKPKKEKLPMDLRSVFERKLAALDPATLLKPWMQTKAIRLITTVEDLRQWADRILGDKSLWRPSPVTGELMPVVAVDTETFGTKGTSGLDIRLVNGEPQIDVAGVCLSADGIEGLYVPLNHEDGVVVDREQVRVILQEVFDKSHLVFFNAKFDREVLRITMGIVFRPYPYFEDVQVLHFGLDPKADLDEEVSNARSEGLKALADRELGIEQIELDEIAKVKISVILPSGKSGQRTVLAPFNWIPTPMAVLYAAPDAITTWLLWEKMHEEARKMKWVHNTDHDLVDALAWVERQRPLVDVPVLIKTCKWHQEKIEKLKAELAAMAEIEDFNPGSPDQLARVLFDKYKFPVIKRSDKTQKASTDADVIEELQKQNKDHPFLETLMRFRTYASLHPDHLHYDPRDHTARMFFKQCTVAGGRLAAMGGEYTKDGGFGMNPQAIKSVGGNKWVTLRRLRLEDTEDLGEKFDPTQTTSLELDSVHNSCRAVNKKTQAMEGLAVKGVVNNHIVRYCGEWWNVAKPEVEDALLMLDGTVITLDKPTKVDAEEVINLRSLFVAPEGYTFFTVDYSNIEMRVAANCSLEPLFINEFLHGSGDFHTLTAKSVFPEFGEMQALVKQLQAQDPRGEDAAIQSRISSSKAKMKELRGLAKIINFALLYGGTEYTIYQNMKAQDPSITKERARGMVEAYWASVPRFQEWAQTMQLRAKETLTCKTQSGRRIDFKSAMTAMKITVPEKEHYENYRTFWDLKRRAEMLQKSKRVEEADALLKRAQEMMINKDTGVANLGDYKKFIGKIQRVAVNAPLQGLAGDFMRKALGQVHQWAMKVGIGDIFLLHSTVHDEIDFSVKNEYVPFVLPRVVRLMKLRNMHAKMKWPVPIETDCEYGKSWDVKEHLTGDDTHTPAGWTKVPGMERYIPSVFNPETVKALALAVRSTDQGSRQDAMDYLRANTHKRCHGNIPKLENMSPKDAVNAMVAILQLHEYWTIEEQDETGANDETLQDYQLRMGLTVGEVVARPVIVGEEPPPVPEVVNPLKEGLVTLEITVEKPVEPPVAPEPPAVMQGTPRLLNGFPQLRNLTPEEEDAFALTLGAGRKTLKFYTFGGELLQVDRVSCTEIPLNFLLLDQEVPVNA